MSTDSARQERVLDLLAKTAEGLQVVVLTCHPERYRGIGQAVQLGQA